MTADRVSRRVVRLTMAADNEATNGRELMRWNYAEPQLEVDVDVLQRTTPDANSATIRIANLNPASRGWLQRTVKASIDKPNDTIKPGGSTPNPKRAALGPSVAELEAQARDDVYAQIEMGYDERVGVFFEGSCQQVRDVKGGPDWFTDISLMDAGATIFGAVVAREFGRRSRVIDVLRHCVRLMGLDDSQLTTASLTAAAGANNQTFPLGLTAVGPAKWYVDTILRYLKAEWFVDFGTFYVVREGQPLQEPEVSISPDSGLVDRPQIMEGGAVSIVSLLRNDIRIGRRLRLDSEDVTGVFRVETVRHRGNNRRGVFNSFIQLRTIEPVPALGAVG